MSRPRVRSSRPSVVGNGGLSMAQLEGHRAELIAAVIRDVRLSDGEGACTLEGVMLAPSSPCDDPSESAAHLIAMGRFALTDPAGPLRFEVDPSGATAAKRTLEVSATRRATEQRRQRVSMPERPARACLPAS